MDIKVHFQLGGKKDKKGLDYIRVIIYLDKFHQLSLTTGYKINPKYWNPKKQEVRKTFSDAEVINTFLASRSTLIKNLYFQEYRTREIDWETFKEKAKALSYHKQKTKAMPEHIAPKKKLSFYQVFSMFLEAQSSSYARSTYKNYLVTLRNIKEFNQSQHKSNLRFEDINLGWFDQFKNYLVSQQLSNATINQQTKNTKAFLNWAREREYHAISLDGSKVKSLKEHDFDPIVLTKEELKRLYEMKLEPFSTEDNIRDVFCFLCFTLQRHEALKNYSPVQVVDKKQAWEFTSQKTRKKTYVPFSLFGGRAKEILEKYDYQLPLPSKNLINKMIKKLCFKAGITTLVYKPKYIGSNDLGEYTEKYKAVTTHTARRTGTTLAAEQLSLQFIQKITNHSSLKTLKKYIKVHKDVMIEKCSDVSL
ncbi:tyrosine-type recombinase/integrase [Sediminitomix flava]|uniref:Site-specific recombinase XerD n=1 Tax=Sediminitomix flava TaxID=379075 RepID=A0A315ZEV7_SEDFL|nr:phage integrase SAM-like domain-containing protein [Sediminitomix flava]PWJ43862.1 site-specific recombinase XerD [Sediminitomix flava]